VDQEPAAAQAEGRQVMACPGLHCPGCGDGALPVAEMLAFAAVVALGSAIATFLADVITAALIVTSVATAGMVAFLAVKMRGGDRQLVRWHRAELAAPAPVKAISGARVGAYVIRQREQIREPRR
jgi:hypothetical protein